MHALAHQVVAQANLQQVDLRLLTLVGDGVQQTGIDATEFGQHLCIELVAFAVVGVDHSQLAGIGDDDFVAKIFQKAADPGTVRSHFHHHSGGRILFGESAQAFFVIGDLALTDDHALGVDHADGMLLIAQIDADGDVICIRPERRQECSSGGSWF